MEDHAGINVLSKGPVRYNGVQLVREELIGFLEEDQYYFIYVEAAVVGQNVIVSNIFRTGIALCVYINWLCQVLSEL